ncbi:MAG: DUF2339 domain-containing protein [Bacteroidota bacterium]
MSESRINELFSRLAELMDQQNSISQELIQLRGEIKALKDSPQEQEAEPQNPEPEVRPVAAFKAMAKASEAASVRPKQKPSVLAKNWEKFIGENLINKIGIAIIVLGVGIGAKYAIDNDLINPLTRIILGYLSGLVLVAFAIKLKDKYENFSAVLLSGAIAILYFISYAAYDFYGLIPQPLAFALMLVFTVFAVLSALKYNIHVIAHIGLVGAYAVPFLLSTGSGNIIVLLSYMTIINSGILFIAFKKDWEKLYYAAFSLTWLILLIWTTRDYRAEEFLAVGLIFSAIFFLIFYTILLAYKVVKSQKFKINDIILLLLNSFIFFSFGYYFLESHAIGSQLLGVFALANAAIHFVVGFMLYKRELADKNLFYFVAGLVIVFVTITIPVQLDGSWVTLLWAGEAALLFWIGRTKDEPVYEKLSYVLMIIGFFSLLQDWEENTIHTYIESDQVLMTPFLNIGFLSSLLVTLSFGFINYINLKKDFGSALKEGHLLGKIAVYALPTLFLITLFNTFRLELANYWALRFLESTIPDLNGEQRNYDLLTMGNIWNICYTLLFFSLLLFYNVKNIKHPVLAAAGLIIGGLAVLSYLTSGLYMLSELRESYLSQNLSQFYNRGWFHLGIRYVSLIFPAMLLIAGYRQIKQGLVKINLETPFELLVAVTVLWVLSSELLNLMDLYGKANSYRLSLSIFWGVYSIALIALGIWKKRKHLRIAAISLFGLTLLKLFFFDIADLNTISKTIVFVCLGVFLLIISFLYNKYKHLIFEENEK